MIPSIANIRKAIYCLNKRIDLLEGGDYKDTMVLLSDKISALESLISDGDTPTNAIDKFNEIVSFLNLIENTETLKEFLDDIHEDISIINTEISKINSELYSQDHEYVDLGLPSGTLWATMNVGASSETDYGNYYQYGKGAAQYAETSGQSAYIGTENPLAINADTAAQEWGGDWHMPTMAQMQELTANTTYEWTTINGINGGKFTAQNGNYIFIPAAGLYNNGSLGGVGNNGLVWSSTPSGAGSSYAYFLYFSDSFKGVPDDLYREGGCSVRPVIDSLPSNFVKRNEIGVTVASLDNNRKVPSSLLPNLTLIQADWNLVDNTQPDFIKNKPTIPNAQIQSDWNQTNTESKDYIKNKPEVYTKSESDTRYIINHDYVEIGGVKWATMNIGAESITDYGKYFQWGDISGYTATQVGTDKVFNLANYKYSDNGTTAMTKYNSTDGKTVLDASDDAVVANWGGSWRMPTFAEFQALSNAVNISWTDNYQSTGVAGRICTAKDGSGAQLFFPAAGYCENSTLKYVGSDGCYWSSSIYFNDIPYPFTFSSRDVDWYGANRFYGFAVRGVLDETSTSSILSDWNLSDNTLLDYIKNKPTIPTKTSDLLNDSSFLTLHLSLSDLINQNNKLDSDFVDDTNQTHKFVSELEKSTWNSKSNFSGNYSDLSNKPTIPTKTSDLTNDAKFISAKGNANEHEYIEIGGIKWATCNLGASSPEEQGLWYQWGSTTGYTKEQILNNEYIISASDYPYCVSYDITKYYEGDRKTNLDLEDDAVHAALGGDWRLPTENELIKLANSVTREYISNYNNSGKNVFILTDKSDNTKQLIFPVSGFIPNNSSGEVSNYEQLWFFSNYAPIESKSSIRSFMIGNGTMSPKALSTRYHMYLVRGVLKDSSSEKASEVATTGSYWDLRDIPYIPPQVLSDWATTNSISASYIRNKPGNETAVSGGTTLSLVTTGEKYTWNNKANIWRGTLAEYDLILNPDDNTIYIIVSS